MGRRGRKPAVFKRPAKKLTREQAALLAAVLPSPKRFRVEAPSWVTARFLVAWMV